jgi:predicted kinase
MPTLTITRGLPGSGKSTWARREADYLDAECVDRDGIRRMLRATWPHGDPDAEYVCTVVQRATIRALLRHGRNVICHDTNLPDGVVAELVREARQLGAEARVQDFRDVPLEVCIGRDAGRPDSERIGEDRIRAMWQRHLANRA